MTDLKFKRYSAEDAVTSLTFITLMTIAIPDNSFADIEVTLGGSSVSTWRPGGAVVWQGHATRNDTEPIWDTQEQTIATVGTFSGGDYQFTWDGTAKTLKVEVKRASSSFPTMYFTCDAKVQIRDNT